MANLIISNGEELCVLDMYQPRYLHSTSFYLLSLFFLLQVKIV